MIFPSGVLCITEKVFEFSLEADDDINKIGESSVSISISCFSLLKPLEKHEFKSTTGKPEQSFGFSTLAIVIEYDYFFYIFFLETKFL